MRFWLISGALLSGAAVGLGAFGAHALRSLPENDLNIWNTAAQYHMYHALGLVALGVLRAAGWRSVYLSLAGVLFLAGLLFFCGSLYVLAASGMRVLGMLAPVGGSAFMLGWVSLAVGAGVGRQAAPP